MRRDERKSVKWRVKRMNQREEKSEQEWVWERAGRKRLYLHEAYLGSRLQNNGRKRVHGTFPCKRACMPLFQGLVAWCCPAVSRDVTLCQVVWAGQERYQVGIECTITQTDLMNPVISLAPKPLHRDSFMILFIIDSKVSTQQTEPDSFWR